MKKIGTIFLFALIAAAGCGSNQQKDLLDEKPTYDEITDLALRTKVLEKANFPEETKSSEQCPNISGKYKVDGKAFNDDKWTNLGFEIETAQRGCKALAMKQIDAKGKTSVIHIFTDRVAIYDMKDGTYDAYLGTTTEKTLQALQYQYPVNGVEGFSSRTMMEATLNNGNVLIDVYLADEKWNRTSASPIYQLMLRK